MTAPAYGKALVVIKQMVKSTRLIINYIFSNNYTVSQC